MKRMLSLLLCRVLTFTALSFSACSDESNPPIIPSAVDKTADLEPEREVIMTPINIATLARPTASSQNKPVAYVNDGTLAEYAGSAWDTWNNRGDDGVQGQNCSSKMLIWANKE